jgi:hypothetical protein
MKKSLLGNTPFSLPPLPPLPAPPRNALLDLARALQEPPYNRLTDYRPKTEWVSGYWRTVPNGLLGYRQEWVPGYWRREVW